MSDEDHNKIPSWYAEIFPAGSSDGFYHRFGGHAASYVERSKERLIVSFDNLSDAGYPHPDIEPWAAKFVRDNGWSHLGVYAQGPSWFRDMRMISFMEKLRDDGFFEMFEKVVFVGTSIGGFAALTFSSLVSGANVIALSPQSTLNSKLVPWENRFKKGRMQDWSLPYSDAALQLSSVDQAYVLYDPFFTRDRRHILRLPQEKLTHLKGFGFGHKSAVVLRRLNLLKSVMFQAIEGRLKPSDFYRWTRDRKNLYLYRVSMESYLEERGQEQRIEHFRRAFKHRRRQQAELEKAAQ